MTSAFNYAADILPVILVLVSTSSHPTSAPPFPTSSSRNDADLRSLIREIYSHTVTACKNIDLHTKLHNDASRDRAESRAASFRGNHLVSPTMCDWTRGYSGVGTPAFLIVTPASSNNWFRIDMSVVLAAIRVIANDVARPETRHRKLSIGVVSRVDTQRDAHPAFRLRGRFTGR